MMAQRDIVAACSSHSMPACTQCPDVGARCPKTLETMSELCFTMPTMSFCNTHRQFCSQTNGAFPKFCDASNGDYLPPMRMYFHFGQRDIILFKDWIPETTLGYVGSFFAIVALGIIVQGIKAYRSVLENSWYENLIKDVGNCMTCIDDRPCDEHDCEAKCEDKCGKEPVDRSFLNPLPRHLCRGSIAGITVCLDFFLMLIAMTFNVGLFIAVVTGVALGAAIFGFVTERQYVRMTPLAVQTLRPGAANEGCCG